MKNYWLNRKKENRFLSEAIEIEKRWIERGWLEGICQYDEKATALLLESQRLMNEMVKDEKLLEAEQRIGRDF